MAATREAITETVTNARFGVMPDWNERLSEDEIRAVASMSTAAAAANEPGPCACKGGLRGPFFFVAPGSGGFQMEHCARASCLAHFA